MRKLSIGMGATLQLKWVVVSLYAGAILALALAASTASVSAADCGSIFQSPSTCVNQTVCWDYPGCEYGSTYSTGYWCCDVGGVGCCGFQTTTVMCRKQMPGGGYGPCGYSTYRHNGVFHAGVDWWCWVVDGQCSL